MYAIITDNVKLVVYLKKINATFYEKLQQINSKRYKNEVLVTTIDKNIALLALIQGARVYETTTMAGLIPFCRSREELLDKVIDNFFEALGIRKTDKGYEYLKYMLKCNIKDDNYCLKPMTTQVYPECAKKFGVSTTTVAKYSNQIIKKSYEKNSLKYDILYYKSHSEPLKEAPKVNNFVVVMANKIQSLTFNN